MAANTHPRWRGAQRRRQLVITKVAPNASKKDMSVFKMSVVQGSKETLAKRELAYSKWLFNNLQIGGSQDLAE